MSRNLALVLLGIAILGLGIIGGRALGGWLRGSGPDSVAERFLGELKRGEYAAAYADCAPGLQRQLKSPEGLRDFVEANDLRPANWKLDAPQSHTDLSYSTVTGLVAFTTARTGSTSLVLSARPGGNWQVAAFDLR